MLYWNNIVLISQLCGIFINKQITIKSAAKFNFFLFI